MIRSGDCDELLDRVYELESLLDDIEYAILQASNGHAVSCNLNKTGTCDCGYSEVIRKLNNRFVKKFRV